jgi:hypothetical protein
MHNSANPSFSISVHGLWMFGDIFCGYDGLEYHGVVPIGLVYYAFVGDGGLYKIRSVD